MSEIKHIHISRQGGGEPYGIGVSLDVRFFRRRYARVFIVVIGIILLSAGKGILQWSQNNRQPLLSVDSKIVSKRTEVKHTRQTDDTMSSRTRTTYYLTFEVESGDRMEFVVNGEEFGMCAEGDEGLFAFPGNPVPRVR